MFFLFLFLQHVPKERMIMLDEDDEMTPELAAKADKWWAKHSNQHDSVSAMVGEGEPIAAVSLQPPGGIQQQQRPWAGVPARQGGGATGSRPPVLLYCHHCRGSFRDAVQAGLFFRWSVLQPLNLGRASSPVQNHAHARGETECC
jgi:hypothetical protein